ncbi:hypothetical protein SO802_017793 [Lithocarpus litseifolius]|uniref:Uncharacterized protein n=1 Tax=Lithocarpus litseifolius TaxID=425828 RepID=A0AAW2CNV6_9ROSI
MGPFMAIVGTTIPLTGFPERGITYLAATNAWWLPYLADEGVRYELLGGCGFSLVPPEGLHAIIFVNPRLLLTTKSVVAYARKQSKSAIFEWQEKEKWWYLYAGEFPPGWEKKVDVVNLLAPTKKGSVSQTTKPKSSKRGDNSFETCSNLVPYKGGLPLIGSIVLESSSHSSTCTRSSRRSTAGKLKPSSPKPSVDAPPSNKTCGSKKKISPPTPSATTESRRADVVAEAITSASAVAAQRAPAKAPVLLFEPIFSEESTQAERVVTGESSPILAEIPTPQKGVTHLSFDEGSEEVFKDSEDEPIVKTRVLILTRIVMVMITDMPEEPKAVVDPTMPIAPVFAVPAAPTPAGPSNFLTFIPSSIRILVIALISFLRLLLTGLCCALCSLSGPSLAKVALTSQFKINSSSTNVPVLASKAAAFFTHFDQAKTNDLDPSDFWGAGSPYVDFHGF